MGRMMYQNFMERYKGKKIFRRMFVASFGLAAVCIFLSCILGFWWFRLTQLQKERQDHSNILYAYSLMFDHYRNAVEDTVEVLRNDTYLKKVMNRKEFVWDDDMGIAAQEVFNMVTVNPMFHSIYVFGDGEYILKSSNPAYPMDRQGDSMMQGIYQGSVFGTYTPAYYIDIYGKNKTLLCLASGEMDPLTGQKENGVLVSLDVGRVMDTILPSGGDGEQYLLLDKTDQIIYTRGGMFANSENLTEDVLVELLQGCDGYRSVILRVQGEKYLATCANIDSEFYLLWLIPYENFSGSINHVRNIFLIIGSFVVLLVLLIAFAASNKVYHPIAEMVQTADGEGSLSEKMSKQLADTELYSIAKTYQSMVQALNHLNMRKEQEELAAYLSSRSAEKKLPEWVEETYGKEGVYSRAVCLRISDAMDFNSSNTEEAIAFELETIRNIVEQVFKGLGNILVTPVNREYLAVLLFSGQKIAGSEITERIREVFTVTGELLHISMDAGVSNEKEGFGELNLMYQMARAATAYRFIYGLNAIVGEDQMTERALHGNKTAQTLPLIEALKNGDRNGFTDGYARFAEELKNYSLQTVRDALIDLAGQMLSYYHSLNYRFAPLSKADYEGLSQELGAYEYMDDVSEWFFRLADEIFMTLDRSRQNGREDIVDKVMGYLQESYADPNISAQLLADRFHITPSYFSRLFHEKCGCAFPDYLAALRIEKAKELLLKDGNQSIQEICEQVGYSNPSYFTTIFKKKFGVTPGQFRRNHRTVK